MIFGAVVMKKKKYREHIRKNKELLAKYQAEYAENMKKLVELAAMMEWNERKFLEEQEQRQKEFEEYKNRHRPGWFTRTFGGYEFYWD